MDGYKVNDVAGFAPVGGCGCLVCRKIHRVQYVAEKLIPLRRKSERRYREPIQAAFCRRDLPPLPACRYNLSCMRI